MSGVAERECSKLFSVHKLLFCLLFVAGTVSLAVAQSNSKPRAWIRKSCSKSRSE